MSRPSAPSPPRIPTAGQTLASVLDVLGQRLPELQALQFADALQNLALQAQLGPAQAITQIAQEAQLSPLQTAVASETQRQQALNQLFNVAQLTPGLRAAQFFADPQTEAARGTLGAQVFEQLAAGAALDPQLRREVEQAARRAQTARGITFGAAPVAAESLFVGQLAEQLRRQRQQAAENLIRLNVATQPSAFQFAQGAGARPFGLPGPVPTGGQAQQLLPGLLPLQQQAGLQQARLGFNVGQLGQRGGFQPLGALTGGLAGGALGGALFPAAAVGVGALGGGLGGGALGAAVPGALGGLGAGAALGAGGATQGAALGSILPGPGTIIGGLLGAALGGGLF